MNPLCTATGCHIPGKHLADCAGEQCRGCTPDIAGDGLRLCYRHADALGANAIACADTLPDLAQALTPSSSGEGGRGTNPHPSLVLNDKVIELRSTIRNTIVSWSKLIHEERGVSLPWHHRIVRLPAGVQGPANRIKQGVANTGDLARYIQTHSRWLAAHEAAGEAADEFATLLVEARRVQGRSGTRVIPVGPCPMEGCGGELRGLMRTERSLLPSAVTCDVDTGHEWTSADWMALARSMKPAR